MTQDRASPARNGGDAADHPKGDSVTNLTRPKIARRGPVAAAILALAASAATALVAGAPQTSEPVAIRVDGVRGQGLSFLNMSVTRAVGLGHRRSLSLRVDVQNLLNRQHWQNANTNPTSTNFGKVTTVTQNYMRFFTFGAKLNF